MICGDSLNMDSSLIWFKTQYYMISLTTTVSASHIHTRHSGQAVMGFGDGHTDPVSAQEYHSNLELEKAYNGWSYIYFLENMAASGERAISASDMQ